MLKSLSPEKIKEFIEDISVAAWHVCKITQNNYASTWIYSVGKKTHFEKKMLTMAQTIQFWGWFRSWIQGFCHYIHNQY